MKNVDELRELQLSSVLSHAILDLHILPTEKCNFRCIYCYEDFQIGKMNKKTIQSIKNLIRRRMPELKQLRISWFGGEPLAASDVVLDISNYAKQLAEENACLYNFGMTTNGYLLDLKRFNLIREAGISSFQISLDGPENIHDKTRLRADGSGTFHKIWTNLLAMANSPHEFEVVLRIHVTPENYESIYELLDKIKSHFKNDSRFSVFLKAIANLGGANGGSFDILKGKTKEEILKQLNAFLGKELIRHELVKQGIPYICYASSQNSWVIRADGTLAKCTVAFNDERNKVGVLKEDGSLVLDHDKIQLWLRGLKSLDSTTMGCPAYKLPQLTKGKLDSISVVVK